MALLIQVEALLMNAKVLTPEDTPVKVTNIQQIIIAINSLSKVFLLILIVLLLYLIFLLMDISSKIGFFFFS